MIDVVVQDEFGNRIAGGVALAQSILPAIDDERFRCAHFIDPYGDTYFNYLQIPYLLEDLRLLKVNAISIEQKAMIEQLEQLVEQYRDERHVYVRFVGD